MEVNYFDLSGNFTLIFFSFSLWETTGPSFSNYALAKKKKKMHFIFSPTKMGSGADSEYGQNQQMTYVGMLIELWGKKL